MKRERVIVLAYHAIGHCDRAKDPLNLFVTPERFKAQMAWLARRARVVRLAEAIATPTEINGLTVAITFDDAYSNLLEHALPVLEAHGFSATAFLPTAYVGKSNTWDPISACDLSIMDESGLERWRSAGMDLQSHGHDHIDMATSDPSKIKADITASLEVLFRLGVTAGPRYLAYPFSDGSERSDDIARSIGIDRAFSIDKPRRSSFVHPRVAITGRDSMAAFALKTSGFYTSLRHSRAVYATYKIAANLLRRKSQ